MDGTLTAPFRLKPSSPPVGAVLLLHGFTGSPWEVRPLGDSLCARGFEVYAPLLPGHGRTPEAMLYVNHRDWEREAEEALFRFEGFSSVWVAGLSMGALLGLILAARFPKRVKGLALMAPAVRIRSKSATVLKLMGPWGPKAVQSLWVSKDQSDIEDDFERSRVPLLRKYPMARLYDLFALQALAVRALPQVLCPVRLLVAEQDHVIDVNVARGLKEKLRRADLKLFQKGFHIMPRDVDRARVATEVGSFFAES